MRLYKHGDNYYLFRDNNGTPQYATVHDNEIVWHDTHEGVEFDSVQPVFVESAFPFAVPGGIPATT